MSRACRAAAGVALALPALLIPGVLPASLSGVGCAAADAAHHVAMVVQHSDGRSVSRCVSFSAGSVTGEQALDASGIEHQYYDYGGSLGRAVCQVDGEPATPAGGWTRDNCLGYPYWSTWTARGGGGWGGARQGISNTTYADGDAEGFRYGDGSSPPPPATGVCPRPPASPTPSTSQPPPAPTPARNTPGSPAGAAPAAPGGGSASNSSSASAAAPSPVPTASASVANSDSPPPTTDSPGSKPPSSRRSSPAATKSSPSPGWIAAGVAAVGLTALLGLQLLLGRRGS